jgi:hypothetical protein
MDIEGRWINQNGSTAVFDLRPDGRLAGHYVSRQGRAARDREYPLVGTINGELVAFQVDWSSPAGNLHAITSFTGRLFVDSLGRPAIHTVWVLVRQFEDAELNKPTGVWNSFLTNSDVFVRAESSA